MLVVDFGVIRLACDQKSQALLFGKAFDLSAFSLSTFKSRVIECEPEHLRLVDRYDLVCGENTTDDQLYLLSDGYNPSTTLSKEVATIVKRMIGRVYLDDDWVLCIVPDNFHSDRFVTWSKMMNTENSVANRIAKIRGIVPLRAYDFCTYASNITSTMVVVLDDGTLRTYDPDLYNTRYNELPNPPQPSIFALSTHYVACSVSNDGGLYCLCSKKQGWQEFVQHGVVHEIGIVSVGGVNYLTIIFCNGGLMEVRLATVNETTKLVEVSDVLVTNVHSINTLHRPKYREYKVKGPME